MFYIPNGSVRFKLDGRDISRVDVVYKNGVGAGESLVVLPLLDTWWPNGAGPQPLHTFTAELLDAHEKVLYHSEKRTGFRTVELLEDSNSMGRSFSFRVNGRDLFIKGCNLVPPAMLLSHANDSAWLALVRHMQRAQMNMVRIWAGGVYPPDAFFDACDTAGILVWQDFMVANMMGGDALFEGNLISEAHEQAERLSAHPSLALLCGDNELGVAWQNWGWQERYQLHGLDSARVWRDHQWMQYDLEMAAFDKDISFVPTSPLSNWGNAEGLKSGDLHYWGVWHGDSAFSSFKNNVGRFVSEYGFQSYPDSALLSHYIDPKELYLGSPAMKRMQRSYKTDKPIWDAIARELVKEPKTLGEFIEDSQEVQAKAYRIAIEAHMAAQPHCMGTLFWQLNDCWPGPSWSLIDFEGNWKPGMYEVQRLYQEK